MTKKDAIEGKRDELIQELCKLYLTYTLKYQKQTNDMHNFTRNISHELMNNDVDFVIANIKNKYKNEVGCPIFLIQYSLNK